MAILKEQGRITIMHALRLVRVACSFVAQTASASASIASDNDSTNYIASEPTGARCEPHGQGLGSGFVAGRIGAAVPI